MAHESKLNQEIEKTQLYFDHHDEYTPEQKIAHAAAHYSTVLYPGEQPTICLVPLRDRWWTPSTINGIEVRASAAMIIEGSLMLGQIVAADTTSEQIDEEAS